MACVRPLLLLALAAGAMGTSDDMGPAAIMWPPDRAWSQQADNTPPCGSVAGVTNRTAFPLSGGRIAFVAQDNSFNPEISISFSNDPKTQSDFTPLETSPVPELYPGHTCLSVPDITTITSPSANQPPSVGTNATIQIKYTADFDRPENQTFYACADITFVAASAFNPASVPCFNATEQVEVPAPTATGVIPTDLPGHGEGDGGTPPLVAPSAAVSTGSGGGAAAPLSKGAIAGAVVGSVLGFALVVGLALLLYRERERRKRVVRQRDSARAVKWVGEEARSVGTASAEGESIRLGNVAPRE
ncbi:uncharacterized protein THITE_2107797 [Thermothielavioides terrestris NRRL 8126]|uniref:Copper acquisition factor BIM1-like domain-containing protein n=1 Tax=Thermothielavioides terrestris (strain ATCC 38088 / NRRL 8126) TaxID=578455 RepID=G2QV81_THETT|nr:uncharacterized protein THITE_2107797 [Thermothielavioides terrestris NRRL 8126]AEO62968.1 hypothetical protein THITE_2107797 [Thermothielavioides terrestris NRRL 8126]